MFDHFVGTMQYGLSVLRNYEKGQRNYFPHVRKQLDFKKKTISCEIFCICDDLRVVVLFVQFKKHEKHPWRSFIFSKVAFTKSNTRTCFSHFLNCTNNTKSRKATHIC